MQIYEWSVQQTWHEQRRSSHSLSSTYKGCGAEDFTLQASKEQTGSSNYWRRIMFLAQKHYEISKLEFGHPPLCLFSHWRIAQCRWKEAAAAITKKNIDRVTGDIPSEFCKKCGTARAFWSTSLVNQIVRRHRLHKFGREYNGLNVEDKGDMARRSTYRPARLIIHS